MTDRPLEPRSTSNHSERAFVLMVVTLILLTPPVLLIFDTPVTIAGVPLLHFYSFAVWLAAIVAGRSLAGRMKEQDLPPESTTGAGSQGD
jgi:hypothetical protein